jgi:hypothetical protein
MREPLYLEDYATMLLYLADAKIMPLRLSRVDQLFVEGIVNHNVCTGIGLTQPQVDLIRTLVLKYNRQLRKHGIDSEQVKTAKPKHQIRISQDPITPCIDFDGQYFRFQFTHRIKNYKDFWNRLHQIRGTFNLDQGMAYPSLANIAILERYAKEFPMHITDSASEVIEQAKAFKQKHKDYKLKLLPNGTISHASPELRAHLRKKTSGMDLTQKLYWLYDRAYEYGYTVDTVKDIVKNANFKIGLSWHHNIMFQVNDDLTFEDIKHYADAVGRKYILWWTSDRSHTLPFAFIKHTHVVKGNYNHKPISILDFDVNKINCCHNLIYRRGAPFDSGMQFIIDNDLESETLLLTNSLKYNTKAKMLTLNKPNGKNNN